MSPAAADRDRASEAAAAAPQRRVAAEAREDPAAAEAREDPAAGEGQGGPSGGRAQDAAHDPPAEGVPARVAAATAVAGAAGW